MLFLNGHFIYMQFHSPFLMHNVEDNSIIIKLLPVEASSVKWLTLCQQPNISFHLFLIQDTQVSTIHCSQLERYVEANNSTVVFVYVCVCVYIDIYKILTKFTLYFRVSLNKRTINRWLRLHKNFICSIPTLFSK